MEDKNKIIPTTKILRVIKFLMKAREYCNKRSKEKRLVKEWHKLVGFVKGKMTLNLHYPYPCLSAGPEPNMVQGRQAHPPPCRGCRISGEA
jgi:hypothetical protein